MNRFMLGACLFALIALGSCSKAVDSEGEGEKEAPVKAIAINSTIATNVNDFSFNLLKQVQQQSGGGNIFISPLSLHMDLGMVLNGATGETQQEIFKTLGMRSQDLAVANEAYQTLLKNLPTADPKVQIGIYNSLWYRNTWTLKNDFTNQLEKYFEATVTPLDFKPTDNTYINKWAYDKTNGKIPKVLDQIFPQDVLYLLNALYFKGKWSQQFKKSSTKSQDFYLEDGNTKTVQMMHQLSSYKIYHGTDFNAIRLPYGNGQFAMTVILPKEDKKIVDVMSAMDGHTWQTIKIQSFDKLVSLGLPRFMIPSFEVDLKTVLQKMGIRKAFTELAELNNIADPSQGHLLITSVKQNSYLKVDEEGTEATAVTSIGLGTTSAPQVESFICDHPFGIIIGEQTSDAILFMGTIKNPDSN